MHPVGEVHCIKECNFLRSFWFLMNGDCGGIIYFNKSESQSTWEALGNTVSKEDVFYEQRTRWKPMSVNA